MIVTRSVIVPVNTYRIIVIAIFHALLTMVMDEETKSCQNPHQVATQGE